jgi:general secretion pathway protein I
MRSRPRRASGFTLVEVLVALVIVAVGMSALLAALGAAADNTNYLRDKTFAQWIALNRVAEQRLQGRMPSRGKTSGETEFAGNRWQWEQEVTELDVPGVLRMDVKVRLANAGGSQNKNWVGNALGVMSDSIGPPISPLEISQSWEKPPAGGPGGDGSGNGDGSNNNNSDNTNNNNNNNGNNNDGNSDQPEPPPPPNDGEQE